MTVARVSRVALSIEAAPSCLDPRFPLTRRELLELVAILLAALDLSGAGLSLTVVDDAAQAELNAEFLGCLGPTNILSFPEDDPARPRDLGALFLSAETLVREAFLYGQGPREHTARLLAHGILHLAGHDHGPEMDELTERAVARACLA
ncbi:probable rRNA maturation factor [Humidesulfovibrio mexicanus]|jgi:probable rRNA maturation factor|uniref:Endoribonuclease YbeY n=1 Tax=Humidesulfovibrio mexicanus TaxID=147047 RepID=A0A238XUJ0_9BACT|nr:rRNA maturation RNase YbeY [Humidesulfovibrio mexicanus]SNR62191.1 probable rRNA maturation factor [Humidesulfovibrio mexicanus]